MVDYLWFNRFSDNSLETLQQAMANDRGAGHTFYEKLLLVLSEAPWAGEDPHWMSLRSEFRGIIQSAIAKVLM